MAAGPAPEVTARPVAALWTGLRRILALSRPYRSRLIVGLLLTMGSGAVWLTVPLGLRSLLDAVFGRGDRTLLNGLTLGLFGLFLVQAGLSFAGSYSLSWVGERVVADLRKRVYAHLHRLGLGYFASQRLGDITSRLTNDVSSVRAAVTDALAETLTQSLSLVGSVGLMVALNWRLSLIVFLIVPAVTLATRTVGERLRRLARSLQDRLADTTAVAEETLSAIRVVKAFAREPFEVGRYGEAVEGLFSTARHQALLTTGFWSGISFLFLCALVVIFWAGGREVLAGRLTTGDLVAFIFYALNISRSVGGLSRLYTTYNSAAGASERIFETLDQQPEVADRPDARPLPPVAGALEFERVTFGYELDRPILRDVSFTLRPGERVALVGPSGAGKTTLLNLVPRFYDPVSGRITLDGIDLRDVTQASLREQIGLVSQEVELFGTSVGENIRYGRLDATDDEVQQAARDANAHEFIVRLADGYRTTVGERGVKLSGGQRQRVAIARALLRDPRLLLLDEATSALDSESEALVQTALDRLMVGRTTLIIAHRLSTVVSADRILVLDAGQIVQSGTHDQLFADDGLYHRLAERQFQS